MSNKTKDIAGDCFPGRKVTEEVSKIDVTCSMFGETVLFKSKESSYVVCNPENLELEEGKSYVISGKCYEIKPNERWPGTPFEVTAIKSLE